MAHLQQVNPIQMVLQTKKRLRPELVTRTGATYTFVDLIGGLSFYSDYAGTAQQV